MSRYDHKIETQEENECKRQADTKDLTSSSKVLRVLGPNLTDAYLQGIYYEELTVSSQDWLTGVEVKSRVLMTVLDVHE